MVDVEVDVNVEVPSSCEAEAGSPRSKLPIKVLPTVTVKVAKVFNEAEATEVKKNPCNLLIV